MEVQCPDWLSLQLCLQNFKLAFPKERFLDSVSQLVCVCVCMHTCLIVVVIAASITKLSLEFVNIIFWLFTLCHLQDLIF